MNDEQGGTTMDVDLTSPLAIARAIGAISTDKAQDDEDWNQVDSLVSILESLLEANDDA